MTADRRIAPDPGPLACAALEATGRHHNDQAFSAVSYVTRSGIGLKTGQPPLEGQAVLVRLALGEVIQTLTAVATRVEQRSRYIFDVGLDWSNCSADELAFLDAYLAARAPRLDDQGAADDADPAANPYAATAESAPPPPQHAPAPAPETGSPAADAGQDGGGSAGPNDAAPPPAG